MSNVPWLCVLWLMLAICIGDGLAGAQQMAHPGWRGNGISNAVWWREAIFVRVKTGSKLAALTPLLDRMVGASADALILPPLQKQGGDPASIDASLGTAEELDALLREASAKRIHVLVTLPFATLGPDVDRAAGIVRFWLSRGVAGVDLGAVEDSPAALAELRTLRSVTDHFTGQRVLLAKGDAPAEQGDPVMVRTFPVAGGASGPGPRRERRAIAATEPAAPATEAERERATLPLLFSQGPVVLGDVYFGAEARDEGWLKQIFALRRSNPALRRGAVTALTTGRPGVSAWLAQPTAASRRQPALMVLSNGSDAAVTLDLRPQLTELHVRGIFLRALLRNDDGTGSIDLERITLPPNGAFAGEVRY